MIQRSHSFQQMTFLSHLLDDLGSAPLRYKAHQDCMRAFFTRTYKSGSLGVLTVALDVWLETSASALHRDATEEKWCSRLLVRFEWGHGSREDPDSIEEMVLITLEHEAPSPYMNLKVYFDRILTEHERALEQQITEGMHHALIGEWTPFYLACAMKEQLPDTPKKVQEIAYAAYRYHNEMVKHFGSLLRVPLFREHRYWGHWGYGTLDFEHQLRALNKEEEGDGAPE